MIESRLDLRTGEAAKTVDDSQHPRKENGPQKEKKKKKKNKKTVGTVSGIVMITMVDITVVFIVVSLAYLFTIVNGITVV
ncbi:hypothetical protein VTL71DRAFT_2947 [Oculimacula yallundae]|uniref:Uncharacterized protein n=1 Tax=Oculimacula yallundae TaxID=86028 RepID=A0ABR4C5Q9_9HELO